MPVVDEGSEELIGHIHNLLIHPDLGRVEGFFVQLPGFFSGEQLFLSSLDIRHWGTRIRIHSLDTLAPLHEHVRLQSLFEEGRAFLGQRIVTESGATLGRCADVQFETKTFRMEWLFPRAFFRLGRPIPVSAIIEVRTDAILVRDQTSVNELTDQTPVLRAVDELT